MHPNQVCKPHDHQFTSRLSTSSKSKYVFNDVQQTLSSKILGSQLWQRGRRGHSHGALV